MALVICRPQTFVPTKRRALLSSQPRSYVWNTGREVHFDFLASCGTLRRFYCDAQRQVVVVLELRRGLPPAMGPSLSSYCSIVAHKVQKKYGGSCCQGSGQKRQPV
ncbi:uncharacterized protein [Dermacentor albipictus]|uniref:uncharacterized protein n=1 Tax=Dermacentor albipictus TaxID=60249 RepID=UPI0038FCA1AB